MNECAPRRHRGARTRARARRDAMAITIGAPMTFTVKAARHVRKKATKGHTDTRPKKHRPSDRNRKAVEYPTVDPATAPAVMTVVSK